MGFFDGISKKIADMRQRPKDTKEFFVNLLKAAEDGKCRASRHISFQDICLHRAWEESE